MINKHNYALNQIIKDEDIYVVDSIEDYNYS